MNITKNIIERNLPLTQKYSLIDKKYIPLLDGCGCGCDNCGRPIANIATVRSDEGKVYNIGFDCLETVLINNSLLSTGDIEQYKKYKAMIPKIIRFSKDIKDRINPNVTGLLFEVQTYQSDWYTFYWLFNNTLTSRYNDVVKLKDIDFNFLVETIKNIFPNLTIVTNQ